IPKHDATCQRKFFAPAICVTVMKCEQNGQEPTYTHFVRLLTVVLRLSMIFLSLVEMTLGSDNAWRIQDIRFYYLPTDPPLTT
ncbi:hypothetical protein L9F63_020337, partial [Diploptera punctata]